MIAEEGKAGRKIGETWSAILVPSSAASNTFHIFTRFATEINYFSNHGVRLPETTPLRSLLILGGHLKTGH